MTFVVWRTQRYRWGNHYHDTDLDTVKILPYITIFQMYASNDLYPTVMYNMRPNLLCVSKKTKDFHLVSMCRLM